MVKYLSFHDSSFYLKILLKCKWQGHSVTHTPCLLIDVFYIMHIYSNARKLKSISLDRVVTKNVNNDFCISSLEALTPLLSHGTNMCISWQNPKEDLLVLKHHIPLVSSYLVIDPNKKMCRGQHAQVIIGVLSHMH